MLTPESHHSAAESTERQRSARIDELLCDPSEFLNETDYPFNLAFSSDEFLSDFWGYSTKKLAEIKQERDEAFSAVRALQNCVIDFLNKSPQSVNEFAIGRLYARYVVAAAERDAEL